MNWYFFIMLIFTFILHFQARVVWNKQTKVSPATNSKRHVLIISCEQMFVEYFLSSCYPFQQSECNCGFQVSRCLYVCIARCRWRPCWSWWSRAVKAHLKLQLCTTMNSPTWSWAPPWTHRCRCVSSKHINFLKWNIDIIIHMHPTS